MDDEKPPIRPVALRVSKETAVDFCCDKCAEDGAACDRRFPCGRCREAGGLVAFRCRDLIRTKVSKSLPGTKKSRSVAVRSEGPGAREVFLKGEAPLFVPTSSPLEINFFFDCLELHFPMDSLMQAFKNPAKLHYISQLAALFDTSGLTSLVSRITGSGVSADVSEDPEIRIAPSALPISETSSFTPVIRRGSSESIASLEKAIEFASSSSTSLEDIGEEIEMTPERKIALRTPRMMVHILSEEESENLLKFSTLNPKELAKIISMLHSDVYATLAVFEKMTETSFDIMVAPNRFFHKLFDYSVEDLRIAAGMIPKKGTVFPMMNLMTADSFLPIIRFWVEQQVFDYESFEGDVIIQDAHGQLTKVRVFMWGAPGLRVTSFLPLESLPIRSQPKI